MSERGGNKSMTRVVISISLGTEWINMDIREIFAAHRSRMLRTCAVSALTTAPVELAIIEPQDDA